MKTFDDLVFLPHMSRVAGCTHCGKPWCRVIELQYGEVDSFKGSTFTNGKTGVTSGDRVGKGERISGQETLGWRPTCQCPAHEPRPGVVLDPFAGSGRTLIAARRLGLDAIGCELNPEYVEMAKRLIRDDAPLFNTFE